MDQRKKRDKKKKSHQIKKKIPGQTMWDLWWTKWHWDRFCPEYFRFPCQFHSTGASLLGETEKTNHLSLHLHHRVAR
jgi:hypothetical protein